MDGSRDYDLCIRQQPKQARMCGVGADRRPIDPPPIVQLRVIDKARKNLPSPSPSPPPQQQQQQHPPHAAASQHSHESSSAPLDTSMLTPAGFGTGPFLQNPYYFMFASLAKPDDDTELHWMKDGKTRCTTGSVVSSLYHLKDSENDNRDAGFFVFPDLSVRQEGSYRLKLSLFEVVGSNVYHCKSIFSSPFYVYTAKKFPGMEESTPLSCSLADQGIKIRIRKDIRQRKPRSSTTNFPITNGQPLGPGVPIQDEESDRESEVRHDDHHSDTTNNHNSLSNITSKPLNGRKRSEREPEKDRERDLKRPRVDGDEGEPAPNPPPSTEGWGIDPALAPGGPSSSYDHHPRSTASVPPPPPSAPGYPPAPPPQHHTYEQAPPPQHHAPQPAHHPPQHQPPHHYAAPPPQSVHPTHHPTHPPPPPPYHTQYPSSWPPPQHPQHPPPPHQYDHYQQHYAQYPPPPRYASAPYDPYAPPPPQPPSVPTYPSAAGYYPQYGRPGEAYGQYPPPSAPPPPAPGPEGPNSSNRNPPVYGQYQPPPPQQPPPPPGTSSPSNPSRTPSYSYSAQPPSATTESSSYPPATPSAASSGGRASTGPAPSAPPPGAGAASMYYQNHAQATPRGYGTPPPSAYPPYHTHPPPPTHHASPPGHYAPYQHPSHPPAPPQGTWNAPNYAAPAPGVYPGQGTNQNGAWEGGAASGHGNVSATTRENGSAPPPAVNPSASTGGPGIQLAPLRGRDDRGDRQPDARTELKNDRERRKDDREPWNGRGHGPGGGAPVNRPGRGKMLAISTLVEDE